LNKNGWLVRVSDIEQGIDLANQLAPEHLELMCRDAARITGQLTAAGAIFIGTDSPTVLGDYVAGPSHVLPAGGTGAAFAGLTVDQFQRRTSVVEYKKPALKKALGAVRKFAEMEGLDAHGWSAEIRFRGKATKR
jgi:histidinol dehydrogenase